MQKTFKMTAALAAIAALGGSAFAQTPPPVKPAPPAHHGLFGNMFHHNKPAPGQPMPGQTSSGHMMPGHMMPGRPMPGHMMGGMTAMSGSIIGNKNTHVYHVAGDKGALPDPKNRMYFRTAAQAEAAGYHQAGRTGTTMKPTGTGHMMHGKPLMAPAHPMSH